jgi:hypothetical protein
LCTNILVAAAEGIPWQQLGRCSTSVKAMNTGAATSVL